LRSMDIFTGAIAKGRKTEASCGEQNHRGRVRGEAISRVAGPRFGRKVSDTTRILGFKEKEKGNQREKGKRKTFNESSHHHDQPAEKGKGGQGSQPLPVTTGATTKRSTRARAQTEPKD